MARPRPQGDGTPDVLMTLSLGLACMPSRRCRLQQPSRQHPGHVVIARSDQDALRPGLPITSGRDNPVRLSYSVKSAAIQQYFSLTINQRTVLSTIINQRNGHVRSAQRPERHDKRPIASYSMDLLHLRPCLDGKLWRQNLHSKCPVTL
jgi:hypothetical protein